MNKSTVEKSMHHRNIVKLIQKRKLKNFIAKHPKIKKNNVSAFFGYGFEFISFLQHFLNVPYMHVLSFLYLVNINPKARTMEDFLGLSFKTIKKYFWNVVSEISKQPIAQLLVQEFYWNKHYTGGHGIKYLTFVTPSGLIAGVFGYLPGSEDDLSILKKCPIFQDNPSITFLGDKKFKTTEFDNIYAPIKGKRDDLTQEYLNYNFEFSQVRIVVEQLNNRLKNFKILSDRCKFKFKDIINGNHEKIFFAIAKLTNLNILFNHPVDKKRYFSNLLY